MLVVATEDQLSETVMLSLVRQACNDSLEMRTMRKNGFGYLKANLDKFCQISTRNLVFVLTDLDRTDCAPRLVSDWFKRRPKPAGLTFCVAVREIESWLLADREGLGSFLGVAASSILRQPDSLPDPKRYLLRLAKRAKRDIRRDLLPATEAVASQGFGYNQRLCKFVEDNWSSDRAAAASTSLARTRQRINSALLST